MLRLQAACLARVWGRGDLAHVPALSAPGSCPLRVTASLWGRWSDLRGDTGRVGRPVPAVTPPTLRRTRTSQ